MLDKFTKHIKTNFPFLEKKRFYLAVSGGIDSMVLVHLFQHFQYEFGILHCNFKLRGDESDADMRFIHDYCEGNSLHLRIGFFETEQISKELKKSIQETARMLRYNWFYEQMQEMNASYVLTAHHLDDSLETFIINLSRGTGIDGLIGIPQMNDQIVRPLLPFSRLEIEEYARINNIKWREDSSNESDKYLRNKIRHHVVPVLKELNEDFLNSFQKTAAFLQQTQELAEDGAYFVLTEVTTKREDGLYFNINKIKQLTDSKPYLYYWLKNYGFTAWDDIYKLLDAQSGKQVFSETHVLLKDRDALILSEKKNETIENEIFLISNKKSNVNFPLKISFCNVDYISETDTNSIFVDEDKIQFPLVLRKWNEGDFFYPFGMKGKKRLSKYFKDEKFSLLEKQNTWILCSNDTIIWVVGHRGDSLCEVTNRSENILKITVNK